MNWKEAGEYLELCEKEYGELGWEGAFVRSILQGLRERVDAGERTEELYEEIMGISL